MTYSLYTYTLMTERPMKHRSRWQESSQNHMSTGLCTKGSNLGPLDICEIYVYTICCIHLYVHNILEWRERQFQKILLHVHCTNLAVKFSRQWSNMICNTFPLVIERFGNWNILLSSVNHDHRTKLGHLYQFPECQITKDQRVNIFLSIKGQPDAIHLQFTPGYAQDRLRNRIERHLEENGGGF